MSKNCNFERKGSFFVEALNLKKGTYFNEHYLSAKKEKTQQDSRVFEADENVWRPESYKKKAE